MKSGQVVDLAEAEEAVRHAVDLAERSAQCQVEAVVVSIGAGRPESELLNAQINMSGAPVGDRDISRLLAAGSRQAIRDGRVVLHSLPVGFSLDDAHGVRDPRGMPGSRFGVAMHVVTADAVPARNLMLTVERCHLMVEAMVVGPYVASLATLADDEADLGSAVIDMGAGTTTMAVFADGRFVHADGFTIGGRHVTLDIARGLGISLQDSERIKTLYGSVLAGGTDERDMIAVPGASGDDREAPRFVSRAVLTRIIKPRAEEILEIVRDRLAASPFAAGPRGRPHRRRVPAHGAFRPCGPHLGPARAHRPAARHFGNAGGGQGGGFRGVGGSPGLSAVRASRACRTAAHAATQGRDGRLHRSRRTMASRELLTNQKRNHTCPASKRPATTGG
jgi:cell division protein FtsA